MKSFSEISTKYKDFNQYDIQVYLSYIFDIAQSQVVFKQYSQEDVELIDNVFSQLRKNIPIQYILGKAYFYSRTFYVNNNVLIPRFDTEILVENAINYITNNKFKTCLDLCCGSGAIGVTINLETGVEVTCSDISAKALEVTKINAINHNANILTIQSNLFENINKKFDIIVSNPPYIATQDIQGLDDIVKNNEPHLALDGKQDGLYFYKEIINQAHNYLNKNGVLCFEVGINQAQQVAELLKNKYKNVKIIKDYNNIERVVIGELC